MKIDAIKTEGRGFVKVLDADDNWLFASEKQIGKIGYCPFCGCEMYLTHKGKFYYYAKKPGKCHTNHVCQQIEKSGKYYSVEKTSFADLIRKLCHVSVSRGPRETNTEGGIANKEETPVGVSVETGFTNLKQIYDYRLDKLKYQTKDEIREIKKYILYHEWARQLLQNSKDDLYDKIVYAKFVYADDIQYQLHFSMYEEGWNCRFILNFSNLSDFKYYYNQLMKKEQNDNGSISWKKKYEYQTALIAAETWERLNDVQTKRMCGTDKYYDKCLGAYMADFCARGQIYLPKALL